MSQPKNVPSRESVRSIVRRSLAEGYNTVNPAKIMEIAKAQGHDPIATLEMFLDEYARPEYAARVEAIRDEKLDYLDSVPPLPVTGSLPRRPY